MDCFVGDCTPSPSTPGEGGVEEANWTCRTGGAVGSIREVGGVLEPASAEGGTSLGMGGLSSLLCHCRQRQRGWHSAPTDILQRLTHLVHAFLPRHPCKPQSKLVSGAEGVTSVAVTISLIPRIHPPLT